MTFNKILLADNNEDFIAITTEFLKTCGFEVIVATNPIVAHQILLQEKDQLLVAIFDARLMDDFDERDTSGIDLARLFKTVPSIVLTSFPTVPDAIATLKPTNGLSAAKDYIDKRAGLEFLLQAIKNVSLLPSTEKIREELIEHFNVSELRDLCLILHIDYEFLAGTSKQDKIRELILFFQRREELAELVTACRKQRPSIFG